MSDADCTPGREPRSVAASHDENRLCTVGLHRSWRQHVCCETGEGKLSKTKCKQLHFDLAKSDKRSNQFEKKGRITAARGWFSRIRQVAPMCTPSNTLFLGPTKATAEMKSWSVQSFSHSSPQRVPILYKGSPLSPSKLPLRKGSLNSPV